MKNKTYWINWAKRLGSELLKQWPNRSLLLLALQQ